MEGGSGRHRDIIGRLADGACESTGSPCIRTINMYWSSSSVSDVSADSATLYLESVVTQLYTGG